jgi:hypothetical protein
LPTHRGRVTQEIITEDLDRNTKRLREALLQVAADVDVAPDRRADSPVRCVGMAPP